MTLMQVNRDHHNIYKSALNPDGDVKTMRNISQKLTITDKWWWTWLNLIKATMSYWLCGCCNSIVVTYRTNSRVKKDDFVTLMQGWEVGQWIFTTIDGAHTQIKLKQESRLTLGISSETDNAFMIVHIFGAVKFPQFTWKCSILC